jgi:hypothetical protein
VGRPRTDRVGAERQWGGYDGKPLWGTSANLIRRESLSGETDFYANGVTYHRVGALRAYPGLMGQTVFNPERVASHRLNPIRTPLVAGLAVSLQ